MALVCFDTMVMVWAIRKTATPGQEPRIAEAAKLVEWVDSEKHRVILTAHAVSEYLTGLDEAGRKKELAALQRAFFIQPFDAQASEIAAKIQTDVDIKKHAKTTGKHYQCVKADVAIIASAIAGRASYFITEDTDFQEINDGRILVKTISEAVQIKAVQKPSPEAWQRPLEFESSDDQNKERE